MVAWPKNIRARLALWYAVILGLILAGCAVAAVLVFSHGLDEEFDRNLVEHFERADRHLERDAAGGFHLRKPERTAKNPQRDFAEEMPVEVMSDSGVSLYQSPAWRRASLTAGPEALQTDRLAFSISAPGGMRFRVMQGPAHFEDARVWIRVALSEERIWKEIRELVLVFLVLFPLGMAAAGLAGYWMARKALQPVDQISRQTEAISADNLRQRLHTANPDDELGSLARVINRLLERMEKSFQELGRFTSDASHELRTPLQALRSLGEVALHKNADAKYYREVISSMLEETDRMSRLTASLMTLTRADGGNYRLQKSPTSLAALVEEVRSLIAILAEEKRQNLVLEVGTPAEAEVDPLIFRQAVMNLVDNAIKYSPEGSEIRIRVDVSEKGYAAIEVSDKGPGIPAEHRERIFDRFYRVDKSRSRDLGGAGLGLSIARWAVEVHGGTLELVDLKARGSLFRICLPAV